MAVQTVLRWTPLLQIKVRDARITLMTAPLRNASAERASARAAQAFRQRPAIVIRATRKVGAGQGHRTKKRSLVAHLANLTITSLVGDHCAAAGKGSD